MDFGHFAHYSIPSDIFWSQYLKEPWRLCLCTSAAITNCIDYLQQLFDYHCSLLKSTILYGTGTDTLTMGIYLP